MTLRNREEHLAASEEFSPYPQPGSFLFSHPSEVKYWCQSIPLQDGLPLTPPDTASDCAISDYAEMNPTSWNQPTMPENRWSTVPAQDNSTMMQGSANEWNLCHTSVSSQDLRTCDASSWMQSSHGPVGLGLSPVLSHESQSTHTLNSFWERDMPLLPPGLDLSFISDAPWDASAPAAYPDSRDVPQDCPSGFLSSPQTVSDFHPQYHGGSLFACGPPQQTHFYPAADASYPASVASDPTSFQGRPLYPRMEVQAGPSPRSQGQYSALQPQTTGHGVTDPTVRVSSAPARPKEEMVSRPASIRSAGHAEVSRNSTTGQVHAPYPDNASMACYTDSTCQDFSNFIRFDQDDQAPAESTRSDKRNTSTTDGSNVMCRLVSSSEPVSASSTADAQAALIPLEGPVPRSSVSSGAPSVAAEADEGRHRTHPLYSEGPCAADGLYHCPFTSDPSCQHRPTKLKCNYDKFIDHHLKPFRCKVEACSKQEFSSTACLLRHEREAHGMHGHGERPHLCFYPGCERGMLGNGFPRRYNLFDHMKRVHDHKEDPSVQDATAPEAQRTRKPASRKRKAISPVSEQQPVARRVKTQSVQEHSPMMTLPQAGFPPQQTSSSSEVSNANQFGRRTSSAQQSRQRTIYSQWANQRELLEFQMSAVRSPDDEGHLQRLSQNIEELRRLSQQARQG